MVWARAALVGGLLLVCAAFTVGVEHHSSTLVSGAATDCGSAISASWLVSGTPDRTVPGPAASGEERRSAAACRPVVRQARVLVLTGIGLGGLLALVGWTAVRRRQDVGDRDRDLRARGTSAAR